MALFAEALELAEPEVVPAPAVVADVVDDLGGAEDAALAAKSAIGFEVELVPPAFPPAGESIPAAPRACRVWGSAAHGSCPFARWGLRLRPAVAPWLIGRCLGGRNRPDLDHGGFRFRFGRFLHL